MVNIHLTNPEFLFFLLALPLLVVTHLYLYKFTKKRAWMFSNLETLKRVSKEHGITKNIGSLIIRLLTVTCVVLAAAGPILYYQADAQPTDYILAIDASASMTAQDFDPNRFEAARQTAKEFVEGIDGAASFGVISYAGYPTIHQTLSSDKQATLRSLDAITLQGISGTDPGGAVITATNLLAGNQRARAIILFSDGLNTAYLAEENPLEQAATYARRNEVTIHALGIGEQGTTPIGYLPSVYNITAAYHPENLRYLTEQTGGAFFEANNPDELTGQLEALLEDPQSRQESLHLGIGLLFAALLLLFAEWGLANTRYRLVP